MSPTSENSLLKTSEVELTPFKSGLGLLLGFVFPGLIVGALLYQISVYDVLPSIVYDKSTALLHRFAAWLAESENHRMTLYQVIMVFSTSYYLTTSSRHRWSSLIFSLALTLLCVSLQWFATHRFVDYADSDLSVHDWPSPLSFALTIIVGAITIPFYRTIFQRKQSFTHYPSLFEFGWNQSVVLFLGLVYVVVVQILFYFAKVLFETIDIDISPYVWEDYVQLSIICVSFAVGIGVSRQYERVIHALVNLIIGLFRAILPLQLLVIIVFVGFVVVSGQENFDNARELKLIFLVAVSISLTLCTAAVGHTDEPISKWLDVSWRLMSITSLCLSIVAVYLVIERIKSYGYTHVHSLAGILTIFGMLYSMGYSVSALMKNRGRDGVKLVNVFGSLVVLVVAIAIQTPMFDLVNHASAHQLKRIKEEGAPVPEWKLQWLEINAGAAGQRVLDELYTVASLNLPPRNTLENNERHHSQLSVEQQTEDNYWQESIDGETLKVRLGVLSSNTKSTSSLKRKLTRNFTFKRDCLEYKNTCRVFISDDIIPDVYTAVVVIRNGIRTASFQWYRQTENEYWVGIDDRSTISHSGQFSIVDEKAFDQLIEDIDNDQSIHRPVELNAITLDGKIFYPSWELRAD